MNHDPLFALMAMRRRMVHSVVLRQRNQGAGVGVAVASYWTEPFARRWVSSPRVRMFVLFVFICR